MKTIFYFLTFTILIGLTLFTSSCVSNKKTASKATPVKKEKLETSKKKNNNTAVVKKKTTVTTTTKNTDAFVPLVPNNVESTFKTNYPTATQVEWSKEVASTTNKTAEYKAFFELDQNKNWIIYSENGDMIESRMQILPDQLPQNIYAAIQNKYPKAHIVSATTIKNSKMNGAYTARIKPQSENTDIEVILAENGTFIK